MTAKSLLVTLCLAVLVLAVGAAVETGERAAEPQAAETAAPGAQATPVEDALPAADWLATLSGRCVCRCTCPSSGASQYQCVSPPSGGSCGSLNGQRCNFQPASTCNVPDIFQNCVPEEVAPVSCP